MPASVDEKVIEITLSRPVDGMTRTGAVADVEERRKGAETGAVRVEVVGRGLVTAALERAVGTGAAAVAFSLLPVTVADLMAISDAGEIMPPKSTWFEPKLRDGLLIHLI